MFLAHKAISEFEGGGFDSGRRLDRLSMGNAIATSVRNAGQSYSFLFSRVRDGLAVFIYAFTNWYVVVKHCNKC